MKQPFCLIWAFVQQLDTPSAGFCSLCPSPEVSPRGLTQRSHPEVSPRGLTQRSHPEVSPRGLNQRSHPEVSPRGLTQRSHPEASPRIYQPKGVTTGIGCEADLIVTLETPMGIVPFCIVLVRPLSHALLGPKLSPVLAAS